MKVHLARPSGLHVSHHVDSGEETGTLGGCDRTGSRTGCIESGHRSGLEWDLVVGEPDSNLLVVQTPVFHRALRTGP